MSNLIVLRGDQEMIWKVGVFKSSGKWVFATGHKNKKNAVFFAPIIVPK